MDFFRGALAFDPLGLHFRNKPAAKYNVHVLYHALDIFHYIEQNYAFQQKLKLLSYLHTFLLYFSCVYDLT